MCAWAVTRLGSDLCQRLDVARVQILASTECDPDDDARGGAPLSSAQQPPSRPSHDLGRAAADGPPAALGGEGRGGGRRGAEETLEGVRAACAEAPAWMIEVSCRLLQGMLSPHATPALA